MIRKTFMAVALVAAALISAPAFAADPVNLTSTNASYLADPAYQLTFGPNATSVVTAPIKSLTETPASKVSQLTSNKCFSGAAKTLPAGYTDGAGVPWGLMFSTQVDPSVKHHLLKVVFVPNTSQADAVGCGTVWFMYYSDDPAPAKK